MLASERWLSGPAINALPNFAVGRSWDQIQFQVLCLTTRRQLKGDDDYVKKSRLVHQRNDAPGVKTVSQVCSGATRIAKGTQTRLPPHR